VTRELLPHVETGTGCAAEVDLRAGTPGLWLLAGIAWPHDERRRREFLAVASGLGLHAAKWPTPENAKMRAHADEALFDAMGGLETVAESPAISVLVEEMAANFRRGQLAGEALYLVAAMALHHREMPPSLNRAFAVMDATGKGTPGRNERQLKENWSSWRAVAPYWAAKIMTETIELQSAERWLLDLAAAYLPPSAISDLGYGEEPYSQHDGPYIGPANPLPLDPLLPPAHLVDADLKRRRFRVLLALSEGFRGFAARYTPPRSRGPLIPEGEALRMRPNVPALNPLVAKILRPLSPPTCEVARAYTVRAIRQ
jgi:hypothetical protein